MSVEFVLTLGFADDREVEWAEEDIRIMNGMCASTCERRAGERVSLTEGENDSASSSVSVCIPSILFACDVVARGESIAESVVQSRMGFCRGTSLVNIHLVASCRLGWETVQ